MPKCTVVLPCKDRALFTGGPSLVASWSFDLLCLNTCVLLIMQVVAANQEVEAANAKRQQESERSLQALQQKSADVYSKQVKHLSKSATCMHIEVDT